METQQTVALVGIGKLGEALVKHWDAEGIRIGIYHPSKEKQVAFIGKYTTCYEVSTAMFKEVDFFILALPSFAISSFINQAIECGFTGEIINTATSVSTVDLKEEFPKLSIYSMKFMGHSQSLFDKGKGLFLTEEYTPPTIQSLFSIFGKVEINNPDIVEQVNREATYLAVKSAYWIKDLLERAQIEEKYQKEALESIVPEVIRSFNNENLGHFGQQIVEELENQYKK